MPLYVSQQRPYEASTVLDENGSDTNRLIQMSSLVHSRAPARILQSWLAALGDTGFAGGLISCISEGSGHGALLPCQGEWSRADANHLISMSGYLRK